MNDEMKQLAEKYIAEKDSYTQKQKAEAEKALWDLSTPEERKEGREEFLLKHTQEPKYETKARAALLNAGDGCEKLWHLVHYEKMPLATAVRLSRTARNRPGDLAANVAVVIEEYNKLPTMFLPSGKMVKKRTPGKVHPHAARAAKGGKAAGRGFSAIIRKLASEYVENSTRGLSVDPMARDNLWKDFEKDFNVMLESFRSKVSRFTASSRRVGIAIGRPKLVKAFTTLGLEIPLMGQPIDLEEVKRQKKRLARAYHPDSNGGDETTKGAYQAVLEAYDVIEQYVEQNPNPSKTEESDGTSNGNRPQGSTPDAV